MSGSYEEVTLDVIVSYEEIDTVGPKDTIKTETTVKTRASQKDATSSLVEAGLNLSTAYSMKTKASGGIPLLEFGTVKCSSTCTYKAGIETSFKTSFTKSSKKERSRDFTRKKTVRRKGSGKSGVVTYILKEKFFIQGVLFKEQVRIEEGETGRELRDKSEKTKLKVYVKKKTGITAREYRNVVLQPAKWPDCFMYMTNTSRGWLEGTNEACLAAQFTLRRLPSGFYTMTSTKWPSWYLYVEDASGGYVRAWKDEDPGPQGHFKFTARSDGTYLITTEKWGSASTYVYMKEDSKGHVRTWPDLPGPQGRWILGVVNQTTSERVAGL